MVKATAVTRATASAVALSLAKEHLSVLHDRTNGKIEHAIAAATEHLEDTYDFSITEKTYELRLVEACGKVELFPYNAKAIESVKVADAQGKEQDLSPVLYTFEEGRPSVITFAATQQNVKVKFKAGWKEGEVPTKIQQAVLMLVSTFYDNDSDIVIGRLVSTLPLTVEHLMSNYKLLRVE